MTTSADTQTDPTPKWGDADWGLGPALPNDPRWARLSAPFDDDVLEWKPQPVKKADRNEQRNMRGRCRKGVTDPDGQAISADDYYCGGYHVRSVHLAYVGHAELTIRLNNVCSPAGWSWEPVAVDANGWPLIQNGGTWIRLTVLGVTKLGFGDMGDNSGANGVKELIGDALRNAAIRFGIATYLWSKSERSLALKYADAAEDEAKNPPPERPQQQTQQRPPAQQQNRQQEQPPQEPTDYQRAVARHREAIAKAHPEWSPDEQRQAVTNAFRAERFNGDGQPLDVREASADDWNWMAQFWEDEWAEQQLAQAEHDAGADADAQDAREQDAQDQTAAQS
jgi:hypothetical protein